jgi:hypothetical protein|nr:MAG TPA: hypothetical protein [Caudoviricetes sp.]
MNELKESGSYLVVVEGCEVIVVIEGCAPMLRITRAFNLSKFIEDGTMIDSKEAVEVISQNPSNFNFKPLNLTIEQFSLQEIKQDKSLAYTNKEYQRWLSICGSIDDSVLISNIMLEKGFSHAQANLIVEQLWKDKRNSLQR